jgi:SAM-dependent methyltransferase
MRYRDSVILRCPQCQQLELAPDHEQIVCSACGANFGVLSGRPVLVKEGGIFSRETAGDVRRNGFAPRAMRGLARLMPGVSFTLYAARAKRRIIESQNRAGVCLIIGAGDNISESSDLRSHFHTVVATDVSVNEAVDIVCDGHDLPFADSQFDFVILTAVLEHVLDPNRVVSEVSRVLKPGGVVFAVTPFMQQVHMGAFDFHRFTDLGHRWLFKEFKEIERGTCGGPASSLTWSITYFAASFGRGKATSRALGLAARTLFWWLKYLDFFLERSPASRDAANGYYFAGKNMKAPVLSSKELISLYVGRNR